MILCTQKVPLDFGLSSFILSLWQLRSRGWLWGVPDASLIKTELLRETRCDSRRLSPINNNNNNNNNNADNDKNNNFLKKFLFIYLFTIFGCVGSSFLREGFL